MVFYDAHCHLQMEAIRKRWPDVVSRYENQPIGEVVVNGTSEADWEDVAELADKYEFVRPAFGLHPWYVGSESRKWLRNLEGYLDRFPNAVMGEVGLDRWIDSPDLPRQEAALKEQLELAAEREICVSVHCLQAWGNTKEALQSESLSGLRFLLHSYGGSAEMIQEFSKMGGYFSVSAYFSLEKKAKQRDALRAIPLDRLLVETDAPHMLGDVQWRLYSFDSDGETNHPGNIEGSYRFVAELFDMPLEQLSDAVEENYRRFVGID